MPTRFSADRAVLRFCRKIQQEVIGADATEDLRMTDKQRRDAVVRVLGCEPLIINARILALCLDERSKWSGKVSAIELHRMAQELHYAVYPAPDRAARRRDEGENQFELDFEWANDAAGRQVAQMAAE